MKILSLSLITLLAAALFFFLPEGPEATAQDAESSIQKWEYKVLARSRGIASDRDLNKFGDEGWELVAVRSIGTAEASFYFKRRKS